MKTKLLLLLTSVILFTAFTSANVILSEPSVCCERTNDGAWCVNDDLAACDSNYRSAPASCESTSYCGLGTCYDSSEGVCFENTPQRVCDEYGGTWDHRELEEVPQCQLGCCIIADQASYVPLVRCKKLATYFGVEMDYRTDVGSEAQCIVLANSQDVGACVYESDFERVCEFTTRGACGAAEDVQSITIEDQISGDRKFYKDYLCSAEELNTVCARQATTACHQGKVHFFDSCGNRENIFSSNRDKSYNNGRVAHPDDICDPNDGTDSSCGNCEYLLGSKCEATQGLLNGENAFCQRTDCTDRWGESRLNGESWCVNDGSSGSGLDKAGSRYYREVCVDGEVRVEPCDDFRNQVCYETSLETSKGEYAVSACRVNRWQACIGITDELSCTNTDKRDCMWLASPVGLLIGGAGAGAGDGSSGVAGFSNPTAGGTGGGGASGTGFSNPTGGGATATGGVPITGNLIFGEDEIKENETTTTNRPDGVCVPQFAPGLQFWEEGTAEEVCAQVSARCVVRYTKGFLGDWECQDNCECLDPEWAEDLNQVCVAQGDCGAYVNYIGKFTDSGYQWTTPEDSMAFDETSESYIKGGFNTGGVIANTKGGSTFFGNKLLQETFK